MSLLSTKSKCKFTSTYKIRSNFGATPYLIQTYPVSLKLVKS